MKIKMEKLRIWINVWYIKYLSMCQGFPILPNTSSQFGTKFLSTLKWTSLPSPPGMEKKWEREENQIKTNSFNQKQSVLYKGFTFSTKKTQEHKIQPASILITNLVFFPHISHLSFIPQG